MTDDELAAALSELDETRDTAEHGLEVAQARAEALQPLGWSLGKMARFPDQDAMVFWVSNHA